MVATASCSRECSLPRDARLLKSASYDRVFAAPRRSSDRYFIALAHRRSHSSPEGAVIGARLGLAISKRCAAGAVARNRIKRVIRESFRLRRTDLPALDVVLLCRGAAAVADNATLRRSLDAHWDRVAR